MQPQTYSRREFLGGLCDHHTYYSQFVVPNVTTRLLSNLTVEEIVAALEKGAHLNSIPPSVWDGMASNELWSSNERHPDH